MQTTNPFDLTGRVPFITGAAGLLGEQHARAIAEMGGTPVLVDIDYDRAADKARKLADEFGAPAFAAAANITDRHDVERVLGKTLERCGRVDILINNAANNPKVENPEDVKFSRFEDFPIEQWDRDYAVGLTGAFLCCQVFGAEMVRRGRGVIVNIASDLALVAPDQRLYRQADTPEHLQPAKPVTYSVVKSGLLGLTRYLATYWAEKGIRVNSLSPGSVFNGQPDDASSYMTGNNLIIDGGRTCW